MSEPNPKVDSFISKCKKWQKELEKLRAILLASPLTEELKWYQPCYTFNDSNVAIISGFKEYCVLSFFKGALLKDPKKILTKPGENTRGARTIRFTSAKEITALAPTIKAYIKEAVELEKSGSKVNYGENREPSMPDDVRKKLNSSPALKAAFERLTPGRRREYLLHFTSAKQAKTREARIDKYTPQILKGKGLRDDYAR